MAPPRPTAKTLFAALPKAPASLLVKPAGEAPRWCYYIGVADIDMAAAKITAGGGHIIDGPHEIPGGEFSIQARDPQGAAFGLVGPRVAKR